MLGFGCATSSGEVRHGLGAGQWEARLPATKSPIAGMAYGSGGSSERADDLGVSAALASLDRSAKSPAEQRAALAAKRVKSPTRTLVASAPAQAVTTPEPAAPSLESRVRVEAPLALAQASAENEASGSRYADREASSKEQQKFAGGDAIVITSGAILLVLLIVLLVLLLR